MLWHHVYICVYIHVYIHIYIHIYLCIPQIYLNMPNVIIRGGRFWSFSLWSFRGCIRCFRTSQEREACLIILGLRVERGSRDVYRASGRAGSSRFGTVGGGGRFTSGGCILTILTPSRVINRAQASVFRPKISKQLPKRPPNRHDPLMCQLSHEA